MTARYESPLREDIAVRNTGRIGLARFVMGFAVSYCMATVAGSTKQVKGYTILLIRFVDQ